MEMRVQIRSTGGKAGAGGGFWGDIRCIKRGLTEKRASPVFFFGAPFIRGDGKSPRPRSGVTGAKRHAGREIISASRPGP